MNDAQGSAAGQDPARVRAQLRGGTGTSGLLVIGVTGHLRLDDAERLRTDLLTRAHCAQLLARRPERLRLLSGLAPGADLVLTEALLDEAARRRIPADLIALLPGDADGLIEDWLQRTQDLGTPVTAATRSAVRARLDALLQRAVVVDLCRIAPTTDNRRDAYRRLAAVLAGVPDLLIAVHREGHAGQVGGTAETLAWRRAPSRIPVELQTLAGQASTTDALVIDPSNSGDPERVAAETADVARIRARLRAGDALSAYDLATAAVEAHDSPQVRYLLLLSLAAAGSAHSALEQFERLAPAEAERDEDWVALRGRLHKDLAFAGIDTAHNLQRAAAEYEAAHARTGGAFSAINAATLLLLSGQRERASTLARQVLGQTLDDSDQTAAYYAHATRAEAHLILGDTAACGKELARANPLLRDDLITRSRTRRQLSRIAAHHRLEPTLIDALEMPCVYLLDGAGASSQPGALPPDLAQRVQGSPVFVTIGMEPAALTDIDALRGAGARVHLVLPGARDAILQNWAAQHDADAVADLAKRIDASERVSSVLGFLPGETVWSGEEAARLALGLAHVAAGSLGVPLRSLRRDTGASGRWSAGDAPPTPRVVAAPQRRMVGLIFTDVVGFRRYTDEDVHAFWADVMPALAQEVAAFADGVLLAATWGDAIHVVTAQAEPAAMLCLRLIDRVESLRRSGRGAIAGLRIRVGAHFAPAFEGYDPVEQQRTYFGTQLAFAASVEPITPPGMTYVTEAFAAQLALEAPGRFQLEYAGELALAKRYGTFRLHGLMPAAG